MPGSKQKKNRTDGEGTWETLPSGKVRLIMQVRKTRIKGPAAKTKTLARELMDQKLRELANEDGRKAGKSLSTLASEWLASIKLSPTTKENYTYFNGLLARDPLGEKHPKDIKQECLDNWKARQTLANSTLRSRCGWLNQVLGYGKVSYRVKPPPKQRHRRRPLTQDERVEALNLIDKLDEETRIFALLCFVCGLRRSEACGVRHDDKNGDGFFVNRAAVVVKRQIILKPKAKTPDSETWVPIPPQLTKAFGHGTGFLVGGEDGPLSGKMLYERIKAAAKGTNLERVPYFGLHALRRTYGMMQLEAGVDVVTAASNMRHDPKMLLDEYARTREDLKRSAIEKTFASFANNPPSNPQAENQVPNPRFES